jgi:hypothetical protein
MDSAQNLKIKHNETFRSRILPYNKNIYNSYIQIYFQLQIFLHTGKYNLVNALWTFINANVLDHFWGDTNTGKNETIFCIHHIGS